MLNARASNQTLVLFVKSYIFGSQIDIFFRLFDAPLDQTSFNEAMGNGLKDLLVEDALLLSPMSWNNELKLKFNNP